MKLGKFLGVVIIASIVFSCGEKHATKKSLETELDSVSYAIGLNMGSQMRNGFEEADIDVFMQGLRSGVDSTGLLLDQESAQRVVQGYFQKKQQEQMKKQQEEAAKKAEETYGAVKEEGIKFLEENKTKDGVQVTESGLQYIVLSEGEGAKPAASSRVKVHYHGTLVDGTVFDSSVDRGTPAEFGVGQVIKGWTEGLQLMNVGSKYKFFIPQELAYGATPRGGAIKPFAALIFEVELLEIFE